MADLSVVEVPEAAAGVETRYIHRKCGGLVLTKTGPPWVTGSLMKRSEVTMHDGTTPKRGTVRNITCSLCGKTVGLRSIDLEVEGG